MLADNAIFIARPSSPPWRRMGEGPLLFGLFALFHALPFAIFSFTLFFLSISVFPQRAIGSLVSASAFPAA